MVVWRYHAHREESRHDLRSESLSASCCRSCWSSRCARSLSGSGSCFLLTLLALLCLLRILDSCCLAHCLCRSLLVEEEREGLAEEISCVHPCMTEHACSVLLYVLDASLVEEFCIFLCISVKEVICTDAEPEEVDLLVCLLRVVVYLRKGHACERAV